MENVNSKIMNLKDVLLLMATGFYTKPNRLGNAIYLQGKHFNKIGEFKQEINYPLNVFVDEKNSRHFLNDKDLLFVSKGENNRTCIYTSDIGPAVASTLFFVLRVNKEVIRPRYLLWYLNTKDTRRKIERMSKGSRIPSVSKKLLEKLEIHVPPLEVQDKILNVAETSKKERQLLSQLLIDNQVYVENALLNILK